MTLHFPGNHHGFALCGLLSVLLWGTKAERVKRFHRDAEDSGNRVAKLTSLLTEFSDDELRLALEASGRFPWGLPIPTIARENIYGALTRNDANFQPKLYGIVPEKTMWAYWYHPHDCPESLHCTLPPLVQICVETIEKNKGGFEFRLLKRDQVYEYVSATELPYQWERLDSPAHAKDALMTALLARYGGVAMDLTSILFEPLDDWWDDMLSKKAIFRGYWYDVGETPVYFMMARRETVFRTAAASQIIAIGDETWPSKCSHDKHHQYLCLGNGQITPALCLHDSKYCKCFRGTNGQCTPPDWTDSSLPVKYEPLNIGRIMTEDPRKSHELFPYVFDDNYNIPMWNKSVRGDVWNLFNERYQRGTFKFFKLFSSGGTRAKKMSHNELANMKDSFLCQWLCLAGHNICNVACDIRPPASARANFSGIENK